MPRFFFDLRDDLRGLDRDQVGLDFPDAEAAYLEAHRAAVEMWAEGRRDGEKLSYNCFEIRDAHDRIILELPFNEALGIQTKEPRQTKAVRRFSRQAAQTELDDENLRLTTASKHVDEQRARVERLEQKGRDATAAKALLATFMQTHALHQRRHDVLKRSL